jgi:hypothetical protein
VRNNEFKGFWYIFFGSEKARRGLLRNDCCRNIQKHIYIGSSKMNHSFKRSLLVIGLVCACGAGVAQAEGLLTYPFFRALTNTYVYPTTPQSSFIETLGADWQVTQYNGIGRTNTSLQMQHVRAFTFSAYSAGFSSGNTVTLVFASGTIQPDGTCGEFRPVAIATKVVDQLDGNLYMQGDFGRDGWLLGLCWDISVAPAVAGPPITITLVGAANGG